MTSTSRWSASVPLASQNWLGKMAKAQMRVYAGVYNRDYGEYKQGVDQYERYTRAYLRNEEAALAKGERYVRFISVKEGSEKAMEYGIPSSGVTLANPDTHREMYERKVAEYKGLYNALPRGYFRSS